jgi:hypothetical protein
VGGDWRPAGRGQEAARIRRTGTKRRSRAAACGTPGRAQKGAPPTPAIDGRPTRTPPRETRRPHQPSGHDSHDPIRQSGSRRRDALSARPPAVRCACADVLSRRTANKAATSAQCGENKRAIPADACRRQRALISRRAQFRGRHGGGEPLWKGYGQSQTRFGAGRQGKAFPSNPDANPTSVPSYAPCFALPMPC